MAFDSIGGKRKRLYVLQQKSQEGGYGFDQVFDVGFGLGIGLQRLERLFKALLGLLRQLPHIVTLLGFRIL